MGGDRWSTQTTLAFVITIATILFLTLVYTKRSNKSHDDSSFLDSTKNSNVSLNQTKSTAASSRKSSSLKASIS